MGFHCNECGDRRSLREVINSLIDSMKSERYYKKFLKVSARHEEDRRLLLDLGTNYRELASCYRSMQESVASIKAIYSEFSDRVKKMKLREEL